MLYINEIMDIYASIIVLYMGEKNISEKTPPSTK